MMTSAAPIGESCSVAIASGVADAGAAFATADSPHAGVCSFASAVARWRRRRRQEAQWHATKTAANSGSHALPMG